MRRHHPLRRSRGYIRKSSRSMKAMWCLHSPPTYRRRVLATSRLHLDLFIKKMQRRAAGVPPWCCNRDKSVRRGRRRCWCEARGSIATCCSARLPDLPHRRPDQRRRLLKPKGEECDDALAISSIAVLEGPRPKKPCKTLWTPWGLKDGRWSLPIPIKIPSFSFLKNRRVNPTYCCWVREL
jgi:hypothetical protein